MRNMLARTFILLAPLAVGCAPADVAGTYTVAVTSGVNECAYDNWTVGESSTGIELVVTQADDQVQLDVQGIVGGVLDLAIGSSEFDGTVSGNRIEAQLIGDNAARSGECSYTTTIEATATVDGDVIEGLRDGRLAMYTKVHHALVDGVSSMRLLQSVLTTDPGTGVMCHADAGYDLAVRTARERGVKLPMLGS